jgi:hypothetical protein
MSTVVTARNALVGSGAFLYQRHRPEKTLLYQLVSKHYPVFRQKLAEEGRVLPDYVQREFEDYLLRLLLVDASARVSIGSEAADEQSNLRVCFL